MIEAIRKNPSFGARIGALVDITKNASGDIQKADDIEIQLIEETRKIGNEVLSLWAANEQVTLANKALQENNDLMRHSKKNYIGKQHSGK